MEFRSRRVDVLLGSGVLALLPALGCGRVGYEHLGVQGSGIDGGSGHDGGRPGEAGPGAAEAGAGGHGGRGEGGAGAIGADASLADASADAGAGTNPSAGDAGEAGATPDAGNASEAGVCDTCPGPTGVSLSDSTVTVPVGGTGGAPRPDTCPENEVVIGYAGLTGTVTGVTFLESIATLCGKPVVSSTAPYRVTITESRQLPMRGASGSQAWRSSCPADQVVVGFDSRADFYLRQIAPLCAPLVVKTSSSGYSLAVGPRTSLPPEGGPSGNASPTTLCPAGEIARGSPVRSGQVIDAIAMSCAMPSLTYAVGAPCTRNADCDTSACDGSRCAPSTCTPGAGCTCASFDERDYAFCSTPLAYADAGSACGNMGMRLTRIEQAPEDGWLRSTGSLQSMQDFFIGGDASAAPGEWHWADGTLFWQGGSSGAAPQGVYTNWTSFNSEPSISNGCAKLLFLDGWASNDCGELFPYACERY